MVEIYTFSIHVNFVKPSMFYNYVTCRFTTLNVEKKIPRGYRKLELF